MAISLEPRAAGTSVGAARGASDPRFGRAQPAINTANEKRSAFAWRVGPTRRFCMVGRHGGAIPGRPERHGQSEPDPTFVGCAAHQANDMREAVTAIAFERPETGLRRMAWARYTPRDGGRSLRRAALEAGPTLRAPSAHAGQRARSSAATNRPAPCRACARSATTTSSITDPPAHRVARARGFTRASCGPQRDAVSRT